jgi:F0F1-type ATP synthase delta subunit
VFHSSQWAGIFIKVLGQNAKEGLLCLNALVPLIKKIPIDIAGRISAHQIEKALKESVKESGCPAGNENTVEYVIRFITLVIEKKNFMHIDFIQERINEKINERNGVLTAVLESAFPVDEKFEEKIKRQIIENTGAVDIYLKKKLAPELLGGFRLWIGRFFYDASLKQQLEKMKTDLEKAVLMPAQGGGV